VGSDDEEPPVHNEVSGSVGGDVFQGQNLYFLDRRPPVSRPTKPQGLPAAPLIFKNRVDELRGLTTYLTSDEPSAKVAVLSGRSGTGGSSLAVQWGHAYGEGLYPDGVLYTDLRKDRANGGAAVADVLGKFLNACGCEVPKETESRRERYLSYLAGKRMLVVLDHVENEAEVLTLRPSSAGSGLIVTTHQRDTYVTGQRDIPLEPLSTDAAFDIVSELVEPDRLERERTEVGGLIELCDHMPRLLCLAVDRMRRNRNMTAAKVTAWLRSELNRRGTSRDRRSVLDIVAGDAYKTLSAEAARVYRLLGHHPGDDVAEEAILALVDTADVDGSDVIMELVDRHLLDPHTDDRYRLPRLIRAHARSIIIDGQDTEADALKVWSDWYIGCAQAADAAFIHDRNRVFPPEASAPRTFADDGQARDWFADEGTNLLALQRQLFDYGWFRPAMRLGEALWVHYIGTLFLADWLESSQLSVDAAMAANDRVAEVRFRTFLSRALMENARNAPDPGAMYARAEDELNGAIAVPFADGIGADVHASAVEHKGRLYQYQGRFLEAIERYTHALELFAQRVSDASAPDRERRANRRGVGLQYMFIGTTYLDAKNYAAAAENLRAAESRLIEVSHFRDVAKVQTNLGKAYRLMGKWYEAHEVVTKAVNALEGEKWFRIEADALWELSLVARGRELAYLERRCLERLRELYFASHHRRLAEVDERLAGLSGS
jgi:tetratricopeptide (TPR) repeat protein